jgi:shikimate kinase
LEEPVALIGYMGSGKTSVGRALSRYLRWRFIDLDREVSLAAGRSIPEIFEDSGEEAFREMEHQALRRAVGSHGERVIACGGGIVTHHPNLETLQQATTVFLEENIGLLYSRTRKKGRPLQAANREGFERRYQGRLPLYREAADHTVVVNGRRPEKVARELERWIRA